MNRQIISAFLVAVICCAAVSARSAKFEDESYDKILEKVTSGLTYAKNGVARFLDGYDNDGILTVVIVVAAIFIFLPLLILPFAGLLGGLNPLANLQNATGRRKRAIDTQQAWTYVSDAVNFLEDALKKYE